jgi:hypothetical protein
MINFLKPSKRKFGITALLLVVVLGIPMLFGFISLALWQGFGFYLWAPIFFAYISLAALFRFQIQDFTVCRFPYCDQVAFLLTSIITLTVFYIIACLIERILLRASSRRL